jgi:virginiamycin B lyase
MRWRVPIQTLAAAMVTALVMTPSPALAYAPRYSDFRIPTAGSEPTAIAVGPDAALWFTEASSGKIGRITTAGKITEYPIPNETTPGYEFPGSDSGPLGITAGPDGALWFTESGFGKIGRITTGGTITEFSLDHYSTGSPTGITTGPDGALWFTGSGIADAIGRITTGGVVSQFPLPTNGAESRDIVTGPDGALWFTESIGDSIGRITTAGAIREFPIPTAQSLPQGITIGPGGALWFSERDGYKIGRITTAGSIREYSLPNLCANGPNGITAGPDHALWFTAAGPFGLCPARIWRLAPGGQPNTFDVALPTDEADSIVVGPDGALWFTERSGNRIGRLTIGSGSDSGGKGHRRAQRCRGHTSRPGSGRKHRAKACRKTGGK